MLYGDSDFSKYSSDFYTGNLTAAVKHTQKLSTDALERFARDPTGCRRVGILRHFGEAPPATWVERPEGGGRACGTCDNCARAAAASGGGKALTRDMCLQAAPVLIALHMGFTGNSTPMSVLSTVASDGSGSANSWQQPKPGTREAIRAIRAALEPSAKTVNFNKEMVQLLVQQGLVRKDMKKGDWATYDVFSIEPNSRGRELAVKVTAAARSAAAAAVAAGAGSVGSAGVHSGKTVVGSPALAPAPSPMTREKARARLGQLPQVILPVPEGVARAEAEVAAAVGAKAAAVGAKIAELRAAGWDTPRTPLETVCL